MDRVLVDTSSWIEALRKDGKKEVRERVRRLMTEGRVVWCDMVLLELWNGARGQYERKSLSKLEEEIERLPIDAQVWSLSSQLAQQCRAAGKTVPATDLLIAACAHRHQVSLEHSDGHFEQIVHEPNFSK